MDGDRDVVLTIRLIRSFEHRNVKNVIYKSVDLQETAEQFQHFIRSDLVSRAGLPPPFRKYEYDTLKIEHHAHGSKSNDPVINRDNDEQLILKPSQTLQEAGIGHESEISFFKLVDYLKYKDNPTTTW